MQKIGADLTALVDAVEASGHSVFAPSAAHRWMKCHASIRDTLLAIAAARRALDPGDDDELEAGTEEVLLEDDEDGVGGSSFFSVEGTAAHALAEEWLKTGREPTHLLGTVFTRAGIEITYDREMFAEVGRYVEWCQALGTDRGSKEFVEKRVDVSWLFPIPRQGGTCDHGHLEWLQPLRNLKRVRVTLTDLKYGKGVRVFAERNPQQMLYAIGLIAFLKKEFGPLSVAEIVIRICQPRLDHFDEWRTTENELFAFEADVERAANACWSEEPSYAPDPKGCRFCPVKGSCEALVLEAEAMADEVFGIVSLDADPPTGEVRLPPRLTTERKAAMLRWRPVFDSLFKRIAEDLYRLAESGEEVDGFKIAEGRRSRAWRDPDAAAEFLQFLGLTEDQIWMREMISPHQAELLVAKVAPRYGKKAVASEVTSKPGPRTLVPIVDPRSGLAAMSDVFEPIEGEDDDLS